MDRLRPYLRIAQEVDEAVEKHRPVVALGTADLVFNLPAPLGLEAYGEAQRRIRAAGAVPAVIAVVQGKLRIGLPGDELARLAAGGAEVAKASRRDLPVLLARGRSGATTVASAIALGRLAGAEVLAAGGIGGVGSGSPFDVSADLEELGQTSALVVCAGVRPPHDAAASMEVLETKGVPVVGYGGSGLPSFPAAEGARLRHEAADAHEAAAVFHAKVSLGLRGGVLAVCPPPPAKALPADELARAAQLAHHQAELARVPGHELAAYMSARLHEATEGRSSQAAAAALVHSAAAAAEIALALLNSR